MGQLYRCDWCQKPYEEKVPLTVAEREHLNTALFVQGAARALDRPICPSCYGNVVGSAPRVNNASGYDIGASNSGPGNLLLKRTYGG